MSGRADDGPTSRPSLLQLCPMTCLPTKGRGLRALQGLGKWHMGLAGGRGHILAVFGGKSSRSWFCDPVVSWVLKLAAESPTCVHMAGTHPCLTSCSSTTQKTGGGKGEGEFPHHQCSWCLAARVLASLGCAGGASVLDQAIAQGGEGLWVSQGISHSAGATKLLQP